MKTISLLAAGASFFWACASWSTVQAGTNVIYSQNTYGFRKVPVHSNNFTLVGFPYTAHPSDLNSAIGAQLTGGGHEMEADNILLWDPVHQRYHTFYRLGDVGDPHYNHQWIDTRMDPQDIATSTVPAGAGFWVRSRQASPQQMLLMGEVVATATATNRIVPGLQILSYPYSTSIALNQTTLSSGATPGMSIENADTIFTWEPETRRFNYYYLLTDVGDTNYNYKWIDTGHLPYADVATNILRPGQAFWYRHYGTNSFDWIEAKPY